MKTTRYFCVYAGVSELCVQIVFSVLVIYALYVVDAENCPDQRRY